MITFMASYLRTPNSEYAFNTEDEVKLGEVVVTSLNLKLKVNSVYNGIVYNYYDKKRRVICQDKETEDCVPITKVTIVGKIQ